MVVWLLIVGAFFVGIGVGCWGHAKWQRDMDLFRAMYGD